MSQHTPGPWKWYGDKGLEGPRETVLVGDCGLATCGRTRLFVSDADKALIAAAPELYAALHQLLAEMQVAYCRGRGVNDKWLARRLERFKPVLAKAEGRTEPTITRP